MTAKKQNKQVGIVVNTVNTRNLFPKSLFSGFYTLPRVNGTTPAAHWPWGETRKESQTPKITKLNTHKI